MVIGVPTVEITPTPDILTILREGHLTLDGLFREGSNYTFLVQALHENVRLPAVYKPTRGEQPLWDFPPGTLARREVAAFIASELLGWHLVPPTVHRDGPYGPGSLQYYVTARPEDHYFNFNPDKKAASKHVVVFDYLANNADRKGSHIVCDASGDIRLFDHGICFHTEYKLRTVIWDFAGEAIPDNILTDVRAFRSRLDSDSKLVITLRQLLASEEWIALTCRADELLSDGRFPEPGSGPNYPWPPI